MGKEIAVEGCFIVTEQQSIEMGQDAMWDEIWKLKEFYADMNYEILTIGVEAKDFTSGDLVVHWSMS